MTDLLLASTEADASAAAAIEAHHAEMAGALSLRVAALVTAAAAADAAAAALARDSLVRWCRADLVPHALAEEQALYPAAHADERGRLLTDGMLAEHGQITGLVDELAQATDAVRAAAAARALDVLFGSHLRKENELIIPLLTSTPGVSLADLLGGMHELLGGHSDETPALDGAQDGAQVEAPGCGGHSCSCGESDAPGFPELDARAVPHAIRHATIFGALDAVPAGGGLVLVAPHDPLPLLAQIQQRWPDVFAVSYLERGPEAWRLAFARTQ
jgi:uncharacterized protein (DUF2249 family)